MKRLLDWIDQRTGVRKLAHEALYENVPGGARWRYVWGSTLTFALAVQFITGIFLWMAYSPSSQTAWESVYYIQYQMTGGWLLRGLHHFTAQVMTVLLVLHLMQVVIDGAYRAPREINFWFGIILLQLVLALSLTGYLLPWDQKGYWATKVATNLMALVPFIGSDLQRLVIGGTDYGHHTLTRFFALHAGVLPGAVVALVVGHIYLFRRHGLTAKEPKRQPDAHFWPDQVLMDAVACLAVLATVLFLIVRHRVFHAGGALGAELGGPADPSEPYSAARPDWYFLFLFQFLKYFPGTSEIWGALIIPGLVMFVIFVMPFIGGTRSGHRFNVGLLFTLLGGAVVLTWQAIREDRQDRDYQVAVRAAEAESVRVKALAGSPSGIPPTGAVTLLRSDPMTQGPRIFAKHCAGCHRFDGHDGAGNVPKDKELAADLKGFASRQWLAGLLDPAKISGPHYYGGTKFADGKMARFVKKEVAEFGNGERDKLAKILAAVSAEAGLRAQRDADQKDQKLIEEGRKLFASEIRCGDCHQFRNKDDTTTAPDLTGYGSKAWILGILDDPGHPSYYGKRNDRMPAFGADQIMTAEELSLVTDWLRGEWYEAAGASR